MGELKVQLATPERIAFQGKADDILVQAEKGELNIRPQHAGLVTFIRPGELQIRKKGELVKCFRLKEGILKVLDDEVKLLCPEAEEVRL